MSPPPPFPLTILSLFLLSTTIAATTTSAAISPTSPSSTSPLDPKQLRALHSLKIKHPCTQPTTLCDSTTPFRHLIALRLANCSNDVVLSFPTLTSLSTTLLSLSFLNCPIILTAHLSPTFAVRLRTFSAVNSLRRLTGVWLSRLHSLSSLTVSGVPIHASGPTIILSNMRHLRYLSITHTNLAGHFHKGLHFSLHLTHFDLSNNLVNGEIPASLTLLENLELLNLSSNSLNGEIPSSIGGLISLKNLSLSSNSLSGSIPESMSEIPGIIHLDLGSNQLNGTIPKFISSMKDLKYLNLENNKFHGVIPFNDTFFKRLAGFRIGGNSNLCYNQSVLSSKLNLGIAPCDKQGLPMLPPPAKDDASSHSGSEISSNHNDEDDDGNSSKKQEHHHGPSKVVLGVAIGLSSIVFVVVFFILLKWCR